MNKPQFTPGPWDASPCPTSILKSGEVIQTVEISSSRYYWLAQVATETGAGNGEGVANTHLIAAAPDLYTYADAEAKNHELWEIGEACYAGTRPQSDYWEALEQYFPRIAEQCPLHTSEYIISWFGVEKTAEEARWELYYIDNDEESAAGLIHSYLISLRTAALAKARGEATQ